MAEDGGVEMAFEQGVALLTAEAAGGARGA